MKTRTRVEPPFPELDGTQPCREDPELFFAPDSDRRAVEAAKTICRSCPFQRPCAAWALTHPVHGIWGGLTVAERRSLQRAHGLPASIPQAYNRQFTDPDEEA